MEVDPEILRVFATEVDEASRTVREANLAGAFSTAFDGTSGSAAQWMAQRVGEVMKTPLTNFSDDIDDMATAVRGTAQDFQVEDETLAGRFTGIHATHPGTNGLN
ncbi:type VII secretion target [Nocardia flavorosea]|uniref:Excreted virulence factor EspC (Type VII ESX diderm) n=1 Tax=Nocardia flavorosea TaxID=53429 RepID=A0A846YSU3_9NOCA|nr:type VII secretion target [Nocardia flavorosea]NKY60528.1 hypothetical protein [Nocardia flavorosea]